MTTMLDKARCATCDKGKGIWKCEGCSQTFCFDHVVDHRQDLSKQMEDVECTRNLIRQTLTERINNFKNHSIMQTINEWEETSIRKIRQTAQEARQVALQNAAGRMGELEMRLTKLTEELRQSRQENDFFETDLRRWKANLVQLDEDLQSKLGNMQLRDEPVPLIFNISVNTRVSQLSIPHLNLPLSRISKRWRQIGVTVAGGHGPGSELKQLRNPVSICIDDNAQSLFIADHWNNRILTWKQNAAGGEVFIDESVNVAEMSHLHRPGDILIDEINDSLIISDIGNRRIVQRPRHDGVQGKIIIPDIECWGLAMDDSGNLYVSDYKRHEVRRWQLGETQGTVVAGGNKRGNRLDQLDSPTNIFVDHEQSVYVSDHFNQRVVKWTAGAKEGVIVAGNATEGDGPAQLSGPTGLLVDQFDTVFVADYNNHRVMCWLKGATKGSTVVGGHGHGEQPDQLFSPRALSTDRQGNLYVADSANHRIQKFSLESY